MIFLCAHCNLSPSRQRIEQLNKPRRFEWNTTIQRPPKLIGNRPRQSFSPDLQDYDVGFKSGGNWRNYTRTLPAGTYNIYLRTAHGIGASGDSASLSLVTGG